MRKEGLSGDPARRFTTRVDNYIKYRPHYPHMLIETLRDECSLAPDSIIADIGSGTCILTELFLKNGNRVFGVEPNEAMRTAAEGLLAGYPGFESRNGRAEATGLDSASVDFITAGQAFHWFERDNAGREFRRILKPGGWVVLVWNDRQACSSPFLAAYERFLHQFDMDYEKVNHRRIDEEVLADFFAEIGFQCRKWHYNQTCDYTGLKGRLLSTSYTPEPGHPKYEPMIAELARLYDAHQENGKVRFDYSTTMYCGRLSEVGSGRDGRFL